MGIVYTIGHSSHSIELFIELLRKHRMQVLVDGTVVYSANLSAVEIRWKMAAGPHTITATATDTSGITFQKSVAITVSP